MFGPPGAGKGTQAKRIVHERGLIELSTGQMLRSAKASGSELGKRVAAIMDRGERAPDDIVIELIAEALETNKRASGFIFDGFPRTVAQAAELDLLLRCKRKKIDRVINLEADKEALLARIVKRFEKSGRADDNPESFKVRYAAYERDTAPVPSYYVDKSVPQNIDGMASIEYIAADIAQALATHTPKPRGFLFSGWRGA
jgi:adenylate kinase